MLEDDFEKFNKKPLKYFFFTEEDKKHLLRICTWLKAVDQGY